MPFLLWPGFRPEEPDLTRQCQKKRPEGRFFICSMPPDYFTTAFSSPLA